VTPYAYKPYQKLEVKKRKTSFSLGAVKLHFEVARSFKLLESLA
jgi:hypothetical protein